MPARVEGYITVELDVSDYGDDISIIADPDDVAEIMDSNNLDMDDMMDYFDIKKEVLLTDVTQYIREVCDHDDLIKVINVCLYRFKDDFGNTFTQMVENRREADQAKSEIKVLQGGSSVSEIRSSS